MNLNEKNKRLMNKTVRLSDYMSDEEIEDSNTMISQANKRAETIREKMDEIKEFDEGYNGEQPEIIGRPNTRINIIHPNIEGQVADMALQDIGMSFQGQEFSDEQFASWARMDAEWTIAHQENWIYTLSTYIRRFLKFGWTFSKVTFDQYAFNGFGISRIDTPSIDRLLIDGKINNVKDFEKAEDMIEVMNSSKSDAIKCYGKEKAMLISYGVITLGGMEDVFADDYYVTSDDDTAWVLLQKWSKEEGKLRCRDYDSTGLLLFDSFKGGDRKENQKDKPEEPNSIYEFVDNKFPYSLRNCYEKEGELLGFGDIKLIYNLQETINNLYDNIRMTTKPDKILIDSMSDLVPEDVNEDSFEPLIFESESLNGNPPISKVSFGTANPEWYRLIGSIHDEIQQIIRYSDLMKGLGGSANTATESAIQERQGSKSTSMKQKIIESGMHDVIMYCLGLDIQFRTGKKALRLSKENDEMTWVDYDLLKKVPATVPMESGERQKWLDKGYEQKDIPNTQIAMEGDKEITRSIALDLKIVMGAKTPSSPALLANIMNQFMSLQLMSEDGKPRPVIFWEEARKFITDEYGLPLDDIDGIKDSLMEYERIQAEKEQQAMQLEQQKAESLQAKSEQQSNLPTGTPAAISEPTQREQLGVMQGNSDFQAQ